MNITSLHIGVENQKEKIGQKWKQVNQYGRLIQYGRKYVDFQMPNIRFFKQT